MGRKVLVVGVALALILSGVFIGAANAEDAGKKLSRGAINATTGWTELPLQMASQSSENLYSGLTYGFMDGLSMGLKRTLYGTWDFITFPVPPFDKPVMKPETVFGEAP